jgi:hypothetical protein
VWCSNSRLAEPATRRRRRAVTWRVQAAARAASSSALTVNPASQQPARVCNGNAAARASSSDLVAAAQLTVPALCCVHVTTSTGDSSPAGYELSSCAAHRLISWRCSSVSLQACRRKKSLQTHTGPVLRQPLLLLASITY